MGKNSDASSKWEKNKFTLRKGSDYQPQKGRVCQTASLQP